MKPLSAFRGAVFDLDGTLLDSMHIWVDIDYAFLRSRGLPEETAYFERIKQISIRRPQTIRLRATVFPIRRRN